jgi:hypothetical protein
LRSDLTKASTSFESCRDKDTADITEEDQINSVIESRKVNIGGCKKGSTKAAAAAMGNKLKDVVTQCCCHYNQKEKESEKARVRVQNGILQEIIIEETKAAEVAEDSVSLHTIRSRIAQGNIDSVNEN